MRIMKKRDRSKPLDDVTFQCRECYHTFRAAPKVETSGEDAFHPWKYTAACPRCGEEREQAPWERALLKAWANATGPRTPEGIAATARNLEGHPTPEETQRTRFNAMKHGMRAKVATYFPAKPDGYEFCKSCDVDRVYCHAQPACVTQTERFLVHHAAFEQRDPGRLMGIYSGLHSAAIYVLQEILRTIIADGVKLAVPEYYTDKDGNTIFVEYTDPATGERKQLMNVEAHPLFRPLGEMISRLNISLSDLGMTVKVQEEQDAELGRLAHETEDRESIAKFRERQTAALEGLVHLVTRAKDKTERDPILIDYQQQAGEQAAS